MSNISCEMLKDLIVLYDDSVCSEEAKKGIEKQGIVINREQEIEPTPIELEKRFAKAEDRIDCEKWSCLFVDDMDSELD